MWDLTKNQGKVPADFTYGSGQKVWLRCPGCIHGCGRHHEWEAMIELLNRYGSPNKIYKRPRLSKEWHSSNPAASQVAKSSCKKYLWVCLEGHPPYKATCNNRCSSNSGCPVCGRKKSQTTRHPVVSVGRPDLAEEWEQNRNTKSSCEVTLGSSYRAWWVCSSNPEHSSWQTEVRNRALKGSSCPACKAMNRFKLRLFGPASS